MVNILNAFILCIPFFLIRFTLLSKLDSSAVSRAAHFAPREGMEKPAYGIYQISNVAIFLYMFFLDVHFENSWWFYIGTALYVIGLMLCAIVMKDFASVDKDGLNTNGLYQYSRNPMYVAYFLFYIGCCIMSTSWILACIVVIFQVSAHWIILSEERWCMEHFGDAYRAYKKQVRRYF